MVKGKKEQSGLMSSAGLMRYFETEESAIKISPEIVIAASIAIGIIIIAINFQYGLWP